MPRPQGLKPLTQRFWLLIQTSHPWKGKKCENWNLELRKVVRNGQKVLRCSLFPSGSWKRETLSLHNLWQQQVATAKRFLWIELAIYWYLTWKRTLQLQAWPFEKAWEISCQLVRAWDRSWNRETHEKVGRLGKSEWFIWRIALSSFY